MESVKQAETLESQASKPSFWKGVKGNFYVIFASVFLVWMFFLDDNDLVNQYQLYQRLQDLEAEKEYYQKNIKHIEQEREALFNDPKLLEKFARERYLMKKWGEDIYIVK